MSNIINPDPRKLLSDDDMLRLVIDRFNASRKMVDNMRDKWETWYKLYRSYVAAPDWPFETALFIPLIFSTIESFLPRMVAQRPRLVVEARNDEDMPTANVHRQLLEYQWDFLGMNIKLLELVKNALIQGTAWGKVSWATKTRTRSFRQRTEDEFGNPVTIEGEQELVVYDDPVVDIPDLEDIYPDPDGRDVDSCRFIIHRMKMQWHELDEAANPVSEGGLGWDREAVNKLKDIRHKLAKEELDRQKRNRREFTTGQSTPDKAGAHFWEFDVLEYWEDDRLAVVVLEPEIILFNGVNPYWHGKKPFIRLVDNVLPNELYGVGEAEILESLNLELNTMHNMRLENVKRDVMQMYLVNVNSPAWGMNLKFKPQGIIPVNDPNDVTPLFHPGQKAASYREEDMLRLWAQLTSGATDPFQGISSDIGNETATGATILSQAASSRVGLKFQILTEMALRPLGELLLSLNEQFIEQDRVLTITGPEGVQRVPLTPAAIATGGAQLDVRIDVGATDPVNKELRLQRSIQGLQVLGQVFGDPNHPAIQTLVARILNLMDISINPEQLAQPVQPQQGQAAQAGAIENPTSRGGAGIADILAASGGAAQ